MPYTPPAQRSPAHSNPSSPNASRRGSYVPGQTQVPPPSPRPDLPRSTSYLTRHRRTPAVKSASFAIPEHNEPTPPGTADREFNGTHTLSSNMSLRQSPPPVTDETQMPVGLVLSPPESAQNSGDEEDIEKETRSRELENLAELQAAIRIIGQHRSSSPMRQAADLAKANQALTLIMPVQAKDELTSTANHVERILSDAARKSSHVRSNTDSSVFINLRQPDTETPPTGSEEEDSDDELGHSHRKPPMLRKKSGELVRPALRPASARRRPSSMPGTPTFSKAVHFDSHLEHVRHFLQVDRPLAVSAGSSPVEAYESDSEFPFSDEDTNSRGPPYEWEIIVSNFPAETPDRLRLPVRVERVFLSADNKTLIGSVVVANLAFNKLVVARFTLDYWKTTSEVVAEYSNDIRRKQTNDGCDRFNFNIKLADQANLEAKTMFFCVKYSVNGTDYWDNNKNTNFQIDFRKKAKPQNGKKGMSGASSRTVNGLPKSNKKSPLSSRPKAKTMPTTFDDFADGFDASSKYDFAKYSAPPNDFLGVSPSNSVRLKGVRSAISLASDNLTRKAPNPNNQAFANRYDFGASLSAAIQAANTALGDRSGITMKQYTKNSTPAKAPAESLVTPRNGTESPRPNGTEQPVLASQSYNELLDKYCFFGSVKSSPQLKDGTLGSRPGQYDGNDDDYVLGSESSSPKSIGSPEQTQIMQRPSPPRMEAGGAQSGRSTSPAPMTGFATGTSPMYSHRLHVGFPFSEAHTATAIRG